MVLLVLFLMGFFLLHFNGFLTLGFYLLAFFIRLCSHGRLGWLYCVSSSCMVLVWAFLLVFTVLTIVTSFRMFRVVAFIGRTVCTSLHGPNRDTFIACVLSHGRLCWSHCVSFLLYVLWHFYSMHLTARSPLLVVLCVFLLHGPSLDAPFGFYCFNHSVVFSLVRMVAFIGRTVCILLHGPIRILLLHASCHTVAFVGCAVFFLLYVSCVVFSHGRLYWLYCVHLFAWS